MKDHQTCPLCGSQVSTPFVQREGVPVHQNLLCRSSQEARSMSRGLLRLVYCETCGFVFNNAFDLSLLSYGQQYDNNQVCSSVFSDYLDERIQAIVAGRDVENCRIVEVGCGDGLFLRRLVAATGPSSSGYGFDPSYQGALIEQGGRLQFERSYYGPEQAHISADIVVCRHVIEHVPEPMALLRAVRQALVASPQARVFFETPCIEWILRHQVVWDLFYEHCSYFSRESLAGAFTLAGFHVEQVHHVFGGQYLWIEATPTSLPEQAGFHAHEVADLAQTFADNEHKLLQSWRKTVVQLSQVGGVALWGAGAKGATFAHLADPQGKLIRCVIDVNPNKQGCFIPGSGHPIVAYEHLGELGVRTAILMNPNYRTENETLLHQAGLDVALVDMPQRSLA